MYGKGHPFPAAKLRKLSTQKKFPVKIFLGVRRKELDRIGENSIFDYYYDVLV